MVGTERWLAAAEALRETARAHSAVAGLAGGTRYETRGRGATVRGVRLREEGDAVVADVGLVLVETAAQGRTLRNVAHGVREALLDRWEFFDMGQELLVSIDVVDLSVTSEDEPR